MSHAPRPPISAENLGRTVTAIANNLNSLHYDASMHDEDVSNDNPVVRDLGGVDFNPEEEPMHKCLTYALEMSRELAKSAISNVSQSTGLNFPALWSYNAKSRSWEEKYLEKRIQRLEKQLAKYEAALREVEAKTE